MQYIEGVVFLNNWILVCFWGLSLLEVVGLWVEGKLAVVFVFEVLGLEVLVNFFDGVLFGKLVFVWEVYVVLVKKLQLSKVSQMNRLN